jgi:hypothetical protein
MLYSYEYAYRYTYAQAIAPYLNVFISSPAAQLTRIILHGKVRIELQTAEMVSRI